MSNHEPIEPEQPKRQPGRPRVMSDDAIYLAGLQVLAVHGSDGITLGRVAQILGVTPVRVRQLIKDGRLVAEKRGRDHLLEDREVQRFKRHGRRSGPKGGNLNGR